MAYFFSHFDVVIEAESGLRYGNEQILLFVIKEKGKEEKSRKK
jgi:hypothetical protein